ncbi:hypothetical protein AVEN_162773-1 [Araneus ventricosus]|uniref:Uncharacterized protein n=1 Tax=Araneus ventricosus TaxID=182803 RepID=A0A4Y2TUI7_ARAVE|nr:hypothetical protein AVEN_162773-1 [Araneus ventricosus]
MCGHVVEDGLQGRVIRQAPLHDPIKCSTGTGHYCHNKRSTTITIAVSAKLPLVQACISQIEVLYQLLAWFHVHILPTMLWAASSRGTTL